MKPLDLDICVCDDSNLSFALIDADGAVILTENSELLYYQ